MQAFASHNWEQAQALFQALTQTWPDCIEAWYQRGEIYQLQGQWSEAVSMYEQVLSHNPAIQEVWLNLGRIAVQQGQAELAHRYWQQALEINPAYEEAHYHLAMLACQSGQMAEASQHLLSILGQTPAKATAFLSLAQELLLRGELLESLALSSALQAHAQQTQENLLLAYQALGLHIQALAMLGQTQQAAAVLAAQHADSEPPHWWLPFCELYLPFLNSPQTEPTPLPQQVLQGLPADLQPVLPRLPQWIQQQQSEAVHAAWGWPQKKALSWPRQSRSRLLVLLDSHSLGWWPFYQQQLQALSSKAWEIMLCLRYPAQQALLSDSKWPVQVLPDNPAECLQWLQQQRAEVLLYSNPELDPLQYWLSTQQPAPLQLAWSALSPRADVEIKPQAALEGALPLWPQQVPSEAAPSEPVSKWLYPVTALSDPAADLAELQTLAADGQLCLFAQQTELSRLRQLWLQLPTPCEVVVWRNLQELLQLFKRPLALWLPAHAAATPYALLALSQGMPLWTQGPWPLPAELTLPAAPAERPDLKALQPQDPWLYQRWYTQLPATQWAVELLALLNQRRPYAGH